MHRKVRNGERAIWHCFTSSEHLLKIIQDSGGRRKPVSSETVDNKPFSVCFVLRSKCRCCYELLVVRRFNFCITQMCTNEKLSDKTLFPTFARTIPPISTLASPLYALMEHFNWSHVAIITQNNNQWAQCDALVGSLNQEGVAVSRVLTMQVDVHYNQSGLSGNFENLLQGAADVSRGNLTSTVSL